MIPLQKYLSHDQCMVQRRISQHGSDTFGSLKV